MAKKQSSKNGGYEKFIKAADLKNDEVTIILRSHLLVEYFLDHLLLLKIPRGDILLEQKFSFSQKAFIVESLDILPKKLIDSVKMLNSVRNRCSHDLEYKVTEVDVDKIGRPFGQEYLKLKKDHFVSIKILLHWTIGLLLIANLENSVELPDKE